MAPIVDNKPKEGERGPDDLFQASKGAILSGLFYCPKGGGTHAEKTKTPLPPPRPSLVPERFDAPLSYEQYCEKHRKEAERQYKHFTRGYSAGKRYGRQWKKIRDR